MEPTRKEIREPWAKLFSLWGFHPPRDESYLSHLISRAKKRIILALGGRV